MAKKDKGHEETDSILEELEKRISKEYKQAEDEVEEKLNDYLARFKKKDALKQKALANGLITQKEYDQWRVGQIMMGKRWEEMRDTLAQDFSNANQIARSTAWGYMPDVYAINHNYGTFLVEKGSQIDTSYTLYSHDAVAYLFQDGEFYAGPGRRITERINMGLDTAWNKQQVSSVMLQGILQGESIGGIATRLAKSVGDSNRKACIRNARTMTTAVESAGRIASFKRAETMGIEMEQEWVATLDNRTRHAHRQLDGQRVAVGKPFQVDGWDIEFPGDPSAPGYLIYNCRCTVIAVVKGHDVWAHLDKSLALKEDGMTYDEWKNSKTSESQSITHQDEVAQSMQNAYNAQYRKYAHLPDTTTISTSKSTIASRNSANGNPSAMRHFGASINKRQQSLLDKLQTNEGRVIVKKKSVNMKDLSALTQATNKEFAMFTKDNQRLIVMGDETNVSIDYLKALELSKEGYRFSGHTHITVDDLRPSLGDHVVLSAFKNQVSTIYDPAGNSMTFDNGGMEDVIKREIKKKYGL